MYPMTEETRESSFDALAKGMASGTVSRGRALRLMGAALVGGTLASLGLGRVAAADDLCKPTGKKCKKDSQCCSGNCSTDGVCSANCLEACSADGTGVVLIDCSQGCPSQLTDCSQCPEGYICVSDGSSGTLFKCGLPCQQ